MAPADHDPVAADLHDNPLTDKNQTRLPRTSAEGNIPRIAVTTGAADALECLTRRIGVADSEFATDGGAGASTSTRAAAAPQLHGGRHVLARDGALVERDQARELRHRQILSCEGSTSKYVDMKPQASIDNVANYANGGGRLFVSHLHFYWLQMRAPISPRRRRPYIGMDPLNERHLLTDQPDVPEGHGAGPVAERAGRERQPDARAASP